MQKNITLIQRIPQVNVQNGPGITLVQRPVEVTVYAQEFIMTKFTDFTFTATQGQNVFTLETTPIKMVSVFINGTGQNGKALDYTISGKTLTLSEGVDAGDKVFGTYQEVATV